MTRGTIPVAVAASDSGSRWALLVVGAIVAVLVGAAYFIRALRARPSG